MQSFGTIAPAMVKAPNLVQMRLINYPIGGILKLSYFWQNFNVPSSHKYF